MNMIQQINDFVTVMQNEEVQFKNIQDNIALRKQNIENAISNLNDKESSLIAEAQKTMIASNDEEIIGIFRKSSDALGEKINKVGQTLAENVKGMNFIKEFENHFTVAVFGKVKAGKSYIGNVIMGSAIKKTGAMTAYDDIEAPIVYVQDRGVLSTQEGLSEIDEYSDFATGMKETTSTIQYFRLGGMCWFDTPGIGSVTWENEMLAKEYVKNADLVIFACNSDAAGTRQEFSEMKQLLEMGKPILLLLTQSDCYEYDINDDDEEISILVPKSITDRQATEQYMRETLLEQGMSEIVDKYEMLTISAKLALEALKNNDEELFEASNMGHLLEKIKAITVNDAADLKKATPMNRLKATIDEIVGSLTTLSEEVNAICQSIENSRISLENRQDLIIEQVKAKLHFKVIEIIGESRAQLEKTGEAVTEDELSRRIINSIGECLDAVFEEEELNVSEKVDTTGISFSGIGNLQKVKESIQYEYVYVKDVRRAPKNLWEKGCEKFFNKTYYTAETRTEIRESVFDVGVNDTEVAQNIMLKLESIFQAVVQNYIESIIAGYYDPIECLRKGSVCLIEDTIIELQGLKEI